MSDLTDMQRLLLDSIQDESVKQRMIESFVRVNAEKAELGPEEFDRRKEERRKKQDAEDNARFIRERSERLIEKSGLADELKRFTFDSFTVTNDWQRQMKDMCQRFIGQDESRFLYLSGQPGCGKTHLGTAVCGEFIKSGKRTVYAIFDRMMDDLKTVVNEDDYDDVFDGYADPEVLYIDDFMKFDPTQADKKHSFKLLNYRMIQRKITVITSERSLNEIIQIDEAMGSRIKQMCGEFSLDITRKEGRNYRLKGDKK